MLEVVFVDAAVDDRAGLLAGLRPCLRTHLHLLHSRMPALSQMARILRRYGQAFTVHVIAHGSPGQVCFSAGTISLENLHEHLDELYAIGRAIGATGRLLLWSCRSGQGLHGRAFVEAVRRRTGAAVTAASGYVGSAARGGLWHLDVGAAAMADYAPPLTPAGAAAYQGLLTIRSASVTALTTDTGLSGTDFITSDPTLVLSGVVVDTTGTSTLNVWLSGGAFGTGVRVGQISITTATTTWSLDLTTSSVVAARNLTAGTYTITLTKNSSSIKKGVLSTKSFTVDTSAPAAPSAPDLVATSDSGGSNTDNVTNVTTLVFTGTAEANSTVTIFSDGVAVGSGTATGGVYTITTSALSAGTHVITATATDAAGNASVASPTLSVTIDNVAPAAPSTPDLIASADSGVSATDNITNVVTPTFSGAAEAGATVTIFSDGVAVGSGVATGGNYSVTTSALTDGSHAITAKATDLAGNVSTASAALTVTIDSTAPATPSVPDLATASDSGTSSTDNLTSVAAATFTGSAETGSTVTIFSDGVAVGSAVATGTGYSVTTSALADGTHQITAQAIDTAGNASVTSAALAVTIDTIFRLPRPHLTSRRHRILGPRTPII
jgi:hypothetical protein